MESIKDVIAKNCKRILDKSQNLSEIARLMKISPTTISRWKSGDHVPELDKIDALAKILDIDASEFFKKEGTRIEHLPVSSTIKKLAAIPDSIYNLAEKIGIENDIWEAIEINMTEEAERIKSNEKKA